MRVGAAYTQTGVLAKGGAKGSAGEIEGLGTPPDLANQWGVPLFAGPPVPKLLMSELKVTSPGLLVIRHLFSRN